MNICLGQNNLVNGQILEQVFGHLSKYLIFLILNSVSQLGTTSLDLHLETSDFKIHEDPRARLLTYRAVSCDVTSAAFN